jgi:hypothetical protein
MGRHLDAKSRPCLPQCATSCPIADSIYAILSDADVRARIDALGLGKGLTNSDLVAVLRALADEVERQACSM